MIIYISGPITGIKNNNADAFFHMENELNRIFHNKVYLKIINPITLGKRVDMYFDEISHIKQTNEIPEWKDYIALQGRGAGHVGGEITGGLYSEQIGRYDSTVLDFFDPEGTAGLATETTH